MFEMEPYREQVKPTFFAPRLDIRSDKNIDLDSDETIQSKLTSYDQLFKDMQEKVADSLKKEPSQQNTSEKTATKPSLDPVLQRVTVNRAISKVYEGFGFLPQDILAKADMTKNKFNFERVKDPDYIYLPDVIKPQNKPTANGLNFEQEIFEKGFFKLIEQEIPEGHTSPHNLNLLHGIGSNPFKSGDADNYMRFQKSPFYSALHETSMTPRHILQNLDPDIWSMINQSVDEILDTDFSKMGVDKLNKLKNPFGQEHPGLKWENVTDPFYNNKVDSFDIYANFHSVVSSGIWQFWDDNQVFTFVNRLWEARTRADDVLREIMGRASAFPDFRSIPEKSIPKWDLPEKTAKGVDNTPATTKNPQALTDKELAQKQEALTSFESAESTILSNIDAWWSRTKKGFTEATVLPFGLMSSFTPLMQTMMDWGNWGDQIDKSVRASDNMGFKDKMINGYLNHTASNYVFKKFKGDNTVTSEMLLSDSARSAEIVWSELVDHGYLDAQGRLTDKFNPTDPDFPLAINVSEGEKMRVRTVLRQAATGSFSLDIQDQTLVKSRRRHDVRVQTADGKLRSLTDIVDLINKGTTPYDRIKNSQLAYDSLFDLHATLVGLTNKNAISGAAISRQSGSNIAVTIANQGSWKEWNGGQWVDKKGAVSLEFHNEEALNTFKGQLRSLIALLEPAIGTFGPDTVKEGGIPFRMLIDNAGSMDSPELITEGHPLYRIQMDTLYDKDFFYTKSWQTVSKHLEGKVISIIRDGMFGRNVANSMLRQAHERKKDDYDAKKQDHEDKEIERMLQEIKNRAERIREEKKMAELRQQEQQRIQNQEKKTEQERQAREAEQRRRAGKS